VLKRNELSSHEKSWRNLQCILLTGRSQSGKGYTLHVYSYMTFWKRQNCSDGEKDQWLPEVGGRQG
jgi:hypothetical protein